MRVLLIALAVISLAAQDTDDWRSWLNRGVAAYKAARYEDATKAFEKAVELNPNNVTTHLYLASAYMSWYVPGAESPENLDHARRAEAEFQMVLRLDPNDATALASLAALAYKQAQGMQDPEQKLRKLDEAYDWYEKVAFADPQNKEAHYSRGVIVWVKWYAAWMKARTDLGMKPEDPGPLPDAAVRGRLSAQYSSLLDQGMMNLNKALEIDPDYDDAMAYMNLLIRERADLRDTQEEYQRDVKTADRWVQKALEARKKKTFAASTPQRIRVGEQIQQQKRIRHVRPAYPAAAKQARIQGTVRFVVIIGKDGRVQDLQLISGHPLLVEAAREAVAQWEYSPTMLNGQPVEVLTQAEITFSISVN